MFHSLHQRILAFLQSHAFGVLSVAAPQGQTAVPVHYTSRELTIGCAVPRWNDSYGFLEEDRHVTLVVPSRVSAEQYWMLLHGIATIDGDDEWRDLFPPVAPPLTATDLYALITISPTRIDLVDERQGWGRRENLDLYDAGSTASQHLAHAREQPLPYAKSH